MAKIDVNQVTARLKKLPGWELADAAIRRQFAFAEFPDAVAFVVRLAFVAEAADHHPDMLVSYKRVAVTYTTHSDGGLTEKDFEGATAADRLAAVLGAR
jgi:4a-hydroxytetrahydrobiopterin dehydratase